MSAPPLVSVVLPVYNARNTIEAAIHSLLTQAESPPHEIIVVDDGSTDGTRARLRKMPGVHVIEQPHAGLVAALNHGLSDARGSYIARMDADDLCHPLRLARQAAWLDQHPTTGLVSCRVTYGGDPARQAGYARHVAWRNGLRTHGQISQNRFVDSPLPHPSVMFRRTLIDRHGSYHPGPFPEDYDLWLRWLEAGVIMEKVPEPLLTWNDPPNRLSRTDPRYDPQAFFTHKSPFLARWLEQHNPHHPDIFLWGAGRIARKRAAALTALGVHITAYIDIAPGKIGKQIDGTPILSPHDLPPPGHAFVISYVASRHAREKITGHLESCGYRLGEHFICAA